MTGYVHIFDGGVNYISALFHQAVDRAIDAFFVPGDGRRGKDNRVTFLNRKLAVSVVGEATKNRSRFALGTSHQ